MRKAILLIDDDPLVLRSLEQVLKYEDYDCSVSSSADDAIKKVQAKDFDLIISDIRMPKKDGVQGVKEAREIFRRESRKDVPILFITGYADDAVMLHAEGVGEVILKPFDMHRFLMTIREYL